MSKYKNRPEGHTLLEILADPHKRKGAAQNELSFMFRDILASNKITIDQWEIRMQRLLSAKFEGDPRLISQEKINLSRALANDMLTWNRFVEGLFAFGYDEYEFTVEMKNKDGTGIINKHTIKIKNTYKNSGE